MILSCPKGSFDIALVIFTGYEKRIPEEPVSII
jgi:hypothetical protein